MSEAEKEEKKKKKSPKKLSKKDTKKKTKKDTKKKKKKDTKKGTKKKGTKKGTKKTRRKKKDKKPVGSKKKIDDPFEFYSIIEVLGEGSYGKVYKGLNKEDGKEYAIKVVHVEDDVTEVEKEIQILAQCDSKYIVKYYDSFLHTTTNDLWMIIENCEGGSSNDIMTVLEREWTEEEIAIIMKGTLHGLVYLHKMKKIHRDIKAGNILLDKNGNIKLTDFGVSAQLTNSIKKRKTVIGTPYWMAPEVIKEIDYDTSADIWSLGITLLELAQGHPPLSNIHPMRAIFLIPNKEPPTFEHEEKFSDVAKDFLSKCLKKNPKKRATARKLLKHPFIKNSKNYSILQPTIDACFQKFQEAGGRKQFFEDKKKKEEEGESESEGSSTDTESSSTDYTSDEEGTIVVSDRVKKYLIEEDSDYSSSSDSSDDDVVMRKRKTQSSSGKDKKPVVPERPTHRRTQTSVFHGVKKVEYSSDSSSSDSEDELVRKTSKNPLQEVDIELSKEEKKTIKKKKKEDEKRRKREKKEEERRKREEEKIRKVQERRKREEEKLRKVEEKRKKEEIKKEKQRIEKERKRIEKENKKVENIKVDERKRRKRSGSIIDSLKHLLKKK